ncbi:MAG: cadmium-translocating P-type ATPase [Oscillospiraceae bacterium]|jgi:Cd2+/Zn2+-exporting ATPase|nr:cadmium-translocating P-type ATPase [Oscillospiraceae bacterium]
MEETIRKEYILDGLCCAACADKMQKRINKVAGVNAASIDFVTQKLSLEVGDGGKLDVIIAETNRIVKQYEPEVVIAEATAARKSARAKEPADKKAVLRYTLIGIGAVLFAGGVIFDFGRQLEFALFLAAYLLVGGDVVWRALKNISKGRLFDENFLMSVATAGAFAIGEYPEGAAVMLFFKIGEIFEHVAVGRSRRSITALMDIRPDFANLKIGEKLRRVSPEEVELGALIAVRPGEKVPLDGVVTEGRSALDTSALTGESLPRDVEPGSEVLSGSVNKNGLLTIRVIKTFGESTVSKILELVQNASARKSKVENFITRFSRYYTPAVVLAAAALAIIPPLAVPGAVFSEWLSRALVFLVVSCPCALVISIPLSFFGGIGGASRNGILVKGSNYLEALSDVDTVVFDKTGTLTQGVFTVTEFAAAEGFTPDELLSLAARAESASTHPIAVSIREAYGTAVAMPSGIEELAGFGIRAVIDGKTVLAGNASLLAGISFPAADAAGTVVYIAVDGRYAGHIVIADAVKADSKQAVAALRRAGVKKTVMITGDSRIAGERLANTLGLDAAFSELLPHQKVEKLEELEHRKLSKGKLVFVGDGINDAPALARADVGIAMGGVGSDAAIEAADVVLMTDEPSKVAAAIQIARKTKTIVWQNVIFALGVKAIILISGAMGLANMWAAVFGDVGVAVIAILNATRAMRTVKL